MPEQLVKADIYVADHSLNPDIARETAEPSRNTNANFEGCRRFAPRLYYRRWDYFLPVFRVIDRSLSQKKRGWKSEEGRDQKSIKEAFHWKLIDS